MDETLRELRRAVECGPAGRRGYPVEVRRRAAAWGRRGRAAGEPLRSLAEQIGVSPESLRRWIMKDNTRTFRRVRVSEPPAVAVTTVQRHGSMVLRLPTGTLRW